MNPALAMAPARPPARAVAVAIVVACLAVYVGAGRAEFYKTDGIDIARLLDDHLQTGAPLRHPWHVGFLPVLDACRRLLCWLGLSPDYVQLGAWFSALGASLGVGFCFAGFVRLAPRRVALFALLALACNPGVLLFATVVEYHGPLLLPLGAAFWWTAVQIGRPTWWGMVILCALAHGAFLMHGQAMFYPGWLFAFFLARRWPLGTHARDVRLVLAAGAGHVLLWWALPVLWPSAYGMWADLGAGLRAEASIGRPQSLEYTPAILWQEWLWPLVPVSWLVFAAPFRRGLRAEFAAFALGLLPFLAISVRQLVFEPECGAYLLPMLPAAALLSAQLLAPWRWAAVLLLCGALPVVFLHAPLFRAQRDFDAAFANGVRTAAAGAVPFVLVGSHRELGAAYAVLQVPARPRDPMRDERFLWVRANATMPREQATPAHFAGVEAFLRALHAAGRAVLITDTALASLDDPAAAMLAEKASLVVPANDTLAGPLFAAHLRQRFELVPAAPGVLRLQPRP